MAIIAFGPLVTEVWGSIGGITFSKASGIHVVKRRASPRKRINFDRSQNQSALSTAIWRWKTTLTQGNINDWNDAAANFSQTRHGNPYTISGLNLYVAVYTLCQLAGQTCPDAPTVFAGRIGLMPYTPSWNAVTHKVKLTCNYTLFPEDFLLIWNTNADRARSTYRKIPYRNFQVITDIINPEIDLDGEYRAQDGTIFYKMTHLTTMGTISFPVENYFHYPYS